MSGVRMPAGDRIVSFLQRIQTTLVDLQLDAQNSYLFTYV